jgi:hypothetical protein
VTELDGLGSGTSGLVIGFRATTRATVRDAAAGALDLVTLLRPRVRRAAARWPRRRVLAISVQRTDVPNLLPAARDELLGSRHRVTFASTEAGDRGRFENLDALLAEHPAQGHDWLLVLDDDVALPPGFLDAFVFLAERFQLRLAQPAHRAYSHAAWQITHRRPQAVVRETRFVEIGPVVAFHHVTFDTILPFPPLRFGWGLDQHWSALALEHGWRIGVVDATPIRHGLRQTAASYGHDEAMAEARRFLAGRPYTTADDAQRTLVMHRSWT